MIVFDISDYPDGAIVLAAFWWGNGGGKYEAWIDQFRLWMSQCHALNGGYDATGVQKVDTELTFSAMQNVVAIDLPSLKKRSRMLTLKLIMMKGLLRLPRNIKSPAYQLLRYRSAGRENPAGSGHDALHPGRRWPLRCPATTSRRSPPRQC